MNSFRIDQRWSIEAQIQYIDNNSNVRNFDRDNLIVLIGVMMNF